jgi:hypothetical protein
MATLITREIGATAKGSPLTNAEVDNNFINLNDAKLEKDNAQYLDFDTAASGITPGVAKVTWNDTEGTLEFGLKGGNVTLQIGQEQVVRVFNNTAAAFSDMQVIRVTGASGQKLTASLAQANSEINSATAIAVVTEPIAANAEGFATTSGLVRNINTSAFTEGAPLYLSPSVSGGITATKPDAPNHTVLIGWCVRSHASAGVIYVNIMNGLELDELHDVKITSVSNGQLLKWVTANSRWENTSDLDGLTSVTITNNSSNPALKITQTGTGNALVVEDAASDTTPFIVDANGSVAIGGSFTQALNNALTTGGNVTVRSPDGVEGGQLSLNNKANTGIIYSFDVDGSDHGRLFTTTSNTNLSIGQLAGTGGIISLYTGAAERVRIDSTGNVLINSTALLESYGRIGLGIKGGTFGGLLELSDSSGGHSIIYWNNAANQLVLDARTANAGISFEAKGTGVLSFVANGAERLRIDGSGNIGIGAGSAGQPLRIIKGITGAAISVGVLVDSQIQSDVTSQARYFQAFANTAASSFTTNIYQYIAEQGTFGAGSAVTNQYGFFASSAMIGATNNYGFLSGIPAGTGRWNFYAAGTADNYFQGNVGIGGINAGYKLNVAQAGAYHGVLSLYNADTTATWNTDLLLNNANVVGNAIISRRVNGEFWMYTSAAHPIMFYTNSLERVRIDSEGRVGIGGTPYAGSKLYVTGVMPQTGGTCLPVTVDVTIPSTASYAQIYRSSPYTQAVSFTLASLSHFYAAQNTIGAGSAISNQYGYFVDSSLTGATNNFGFYSNIPAGTGRWNIYSAGTAQNYLAGTLAIGNSSSYNADVYGKLLVMGAQAATSSSTLALMTQDNAQGLKANLSFYSTFIGTADNGPRRVADILAGFTNAWSTEYLAFNVGVGAGGNDSRSVTTERMRIRGDGNVAIGSTGTANYSLIVSKNVTGSTNSADVRAQGVIQSDVTNLAIGFTHQPLTAAAAFTCGNIQGFRYDGVSLGAGSAVTNQYGFIAESSTTGATNNFGFYSNLPSGTGRWNFYASGLAQNYFAANINIGADAAAQSVANQDMLRIRQVNSAGVVRAQVINPATANGTQARYDLATGTANAYGIISITENGSGICSMEFASGAGITNGMFFTSVGTAPIILRQDANERLRIGTDGGVSIGTSAAAGTGALRVVNTLLASDRLEINGLGSGNRYAYVDLIGDDTFTDYALRLIRDNGGSNAASKLIHRGTGSLYISTQDAGNLILNTTNTDRLIISASGNVGVGSQSPVSKLDIGPVDSANEGAEVRLRGAANAVVDWNYDVFQNSLRFFTTDKGTTANWQGRLSLSHDSGIMIQTGAATFVGHSIRNTAASATVTAHSYVDFQNESNVATGSIINVHGTDGSSRLDFSTTPSGARNSDRRAAVFQIYGNGNVLAINPNGGLGYGTGAGGAVTQVTSKSTAVTLNKPTGKITMHNAALAASNIVGFSVQNSLVTVNDVIVASVVGVGYYGVTTEPYAGGFNIWLRNHDSVGHADAVVINFAVIKGTTA